MSRFRAIKTVTDLERVFDNIITQCRDDEEGYAATYIEEFNELLDTLYKEDFFGTEGSTDPRGDHRD